LTTFTRHIFLILLLAAAFPGFAQKKGKENPISAEKRQELDKAFVNGNKEKILQNYDEALKFFRFCYDMEPDNAAVNFVIADTYLLKKQYEEAEGYAVKAAQLDPSNIWYKELLVDIYVSRKKSREAADLMVQIGRERKEVQNYLQASYLYVMARDYKKAIAVLDEVEKQAGINEDVVKQKEQIYLAQGKTDKAIKEVEKLIKAFPSDTRYMGMLADLYLAKGKEKEAVAIYNDILRKEPANGFALFSLAEYYKSRGDKEQWFSYLKMGMASTNVDAKSKINVLSSFIGGKEFTDQLDRTFILADIFSQTNKEEPSPYLVLGDLYLQQHKLDSARLEYRNALSIEPSTYIAWQQVVFCSSEMRNNELLLKDCEEAAEYFPNEPLFYAYAAIASMQLKMYDRAVTNATKGLDVITPDQQDLQTQLFATLGDAYHYQKNYAACDSVFEEALKLDPSNAYALNNYAYFLSLRKTRLDKAEEMSKKSLDLDPENASYMDTYGWILFVRKDYVKAKEYIEKSLVYAPNNAEVLDHLGDVLYMLNDKAGAIKNWKKAKELGADNVHLDKKISEGKIYE
jgi:tetratricopeptide (TPR) repeat protein